MFFCQKSKKSLRDQKQKSKTKNPKPPKKQYLFEKWAGRYVKWEVVMSKILNINQFLVFSFLCYVLNS